MKTERKRLLIPVYKGYIFTWNEKQGSIDVSDLSEEAVDICQDGRWDGQIWNDSSDVGFEVKSEETSAIELFVFERTELNEENLVGAWYYRCQEDPSMTIIVHND